MSTKSVDVDLVDSSEKKSAMVCDLVKGVDWGKAEVSLTVYDRRGDQATSSKATRCACSSLLILRNH